jgi:hypothetical protein
MEEGKEVVFLPLFADQAPFSFILAERGFFYYARDTARKQTEKKEQSWTFKP